MKLETDTSCIWVNGMRNGNETVRSYLRVNVCIPKLSN